MSIIIVAEGERGVGNIRCMLTRSMKSRYCDLDLDLDHCLPFRE